MTQTPIGIPTMPPLSSCLAHLDIVEISEAVRIETRSRETLLPPVSVYRWWARRTEAVNGALLEAVAAERAGPMLVADPFAGGGVIALSALRRGHALYAQDLNPWAAEGLQAMLGLPPASEINAAGEALLARAAPLATRAYATNLSDGTPAQLSQSIRVVHSRCSACGTAHRLFPHALVTLLTRKERSTGDAMLACRFGHLFRGASDGTQNCPECRSNVEPGEGYHPSRIVTCPHCGHAESLQQRSQNGSWNWELALVERTDGARRELAIPTAAEIEQAASERWSARRKLGAIPDTAETRVLRRHGFESWSDLYPTRQIHVTERLLAYAKALDADERVRRALTMAVLGTTEMAGHMSRWDRYYLKSYESMASHRFNLTTLSAEPNAVGAGAAGRGTLRRRIGMLEKAAAWSEANAAARPVSGWLAERGTPVPDPIGTTNVVAGSSEHLLLEDASVDLILTDPPYHDDVQYHELSLPFRAWAQLTRARIGGEAVAIPHSPLLSGHRKYRDTLQRIFCELRRVLKPEGRLLFSYANREAAAWVNLFAALRGAGLQPLGYAIVPSENESDHAKRGGRACTFDLILELVPAAAQIAAQWRPEAHFRNEEEDYLVAVGEAFLRSAGFVNGWEAELVEVLRAHPFVRVRKGAANGPAMTLEDADKVAAALVAPELLEKVRPIGLASCMPPPANFPDGQASASAVTKF